MCWETQRSQIWLEYRLHERERERISVVLGSYTKQGEGKSKAVGLWLVGALGASPRLKGRVDRPLAEIKLQR